MKQGTGQAAPHKSYTTSRQQYCAGKQGAVAGRRQRSSVGKGRTGQAVQRVKGATEGQEMRAADVRRCWVGRHMRARQRGAAVAHASCYGKESPSRHVRAARWAGIMRCNSCGVAQAVPGWGRVSQEASPHHRLGEGRLAAPHDCREGGPESNEVGWLVWRACMPGCLPVGPSREVAAQASGSSEAGLTALAQVHTACCPAKSRTH